ncbi:hypothetical protein FBY31_4562 [Arthrobacter sp. SLBN-100]|nr:hypothetical protein FBY31_4562 [Arthrobacter sp. SLBN-100]
MGNLWPRRVACAPIEARRPKLLFLNRTRDFKRYATHSSDGL